MGMGYGETDMELTEQLSDEDVLIELFDRWWELWPKNAKQNRKDAERAWQKVFYKEPGFPREDWVHHAENVLMQGLKDQIAYRTRVFDKYPTPEDRKRADVFIARLPMPATWLNGGRWQNPVPQLAVESPKYRSATLTCNECEEESVIKIDDLEYCCWHWTKAFNKPHLRLLAETLKNINLERRPEEDKSDWGERCREHLKGSRWGDALGA